MGHDASENEALQEQDAATTEGTDAGLWTLPGRVLAVLGGMMIVLMMMHICIDVAARYFFNAPLWGTLEIASGYYMVGIIFLPLAHVTRKHGHIVADLFTRHLRPVHLRFLSGIIGLFAVVYLGFMAWQTTLSALSSMEIGEAWETAADIIIIWPSRWVLPFACGLSALYLLHRAIRNLCRTAA